MAADNPGDVSMRTMLSPAAAMLVAGVIAARALATARERAA